MPARHRYLQNISNDGGYDDDDFYDEEGEDELQDGNEELNPEDAKQMRESLASVREVIGPQATSGISDREIEDSLWHYYYDVEKTINYVLSHKAGDESATESKPKAQAKSSEPTPKKVKVSHFPTNLCHSTPQWSAEDFFSDCPWLNVPDPKRAEILVERHIPRGGLLGGSGEPKMSKLAALAAAKRKQAAEKASAGGGGATILEQLRTRTEKPVALTKDTAQAMESPGSGSSVPQKRTTSDAESGEPKRPQPIQRELSITSKVEDLSINTTKEDSPPANPSLLAETLFGEEPSQPSQPTTNTASSTPFFAAPHFSSASTSTRTDPFAGPSPDDIVANAQSNAKGFSNTKAKSTPVKEKTTKKTEQTTSSTMAPEASKVKSKNLDVPAEYAKESRKESANFVVIGHVDAGKSTLMGRLLYDLKQVDQRTIDKYKKEAASLGKSSFHLAWVLDQGSEERSRGVTIDIATNRFETEKTSFTILDAPGHQDFIPNMIAGTAQADFAVLVIDASVGAFESGLRGQTKEHALLARSMGIPRLVVAVNKLDAVQWSKDRFDEIRAQVSAFLSAAGFQPKNVTFVACSGLSGHNLTRRCEDEASKWYTGPLLVEALESTDTIKRKIQGPFRLPISDVFRGGVQYPLSISGRIESGNVQVGDRMVDVPTNEIVFAKAIEVDGKPADYAVAGQNATIHLVELENAQLRPGDILCSTEPPLVPLKSFTMKALAFEHLTPMDIDVHKGRLHVAAKIIGFISILDKATGEITKKRPKVVKPGEIARVKVEVEGDNVVPVEKGGRVVLRANGETVAAGLVD